MADKLSDYYKQGIVDAVSEFEKTAVFQVLMQDGSFREAFSRRLQEKISSINLEKAKSGGYENGRSSPSEI